MGLNTLTPIVGGTIVIANVNDIHTALKGDIVPRNASGVPEDLAGSLGTPSLQWLEGRFKSIFVDGKGIGDISVGLVTKNKVISGPTRSTSNQPAFIVPAGVAGGATFVLDCDPVNIIYNVNDSIFTCDADIASGALTVAPNTNNTALVNDIGADDTEKTRTWGEFLGHRPFITIDTVGTEISGLVGTFQSFSINDGVTDEYFIAFIESATELKLAQRGYYYDDSLLPINRLRFTNNDVITLMSTAWVFLTNSETLIISYNNPVWSFTEPVGPATDDMWFDFEVDFWKRFNGATFETANAIYIGNAIIDDTDCVGARSSDLAAAYSRENNIRFSAPTATTIQTRENFNVAVIGGNKVETMFGFLDWDIATDLAIAADMYDATEQANRIYYAYLTDEFEEVFSDVHPYYRPEFFGFYHPHNPWRAIGYVRNNGASNFTSYGFFPGEPSLVRADWANWSNTATQNLTTGAGFEKIVITGTLTVEGHAIFEVANVIGFRMPGIYDWWFRADGRSTTATVGDIDYRIRDTLNGVTLVDLGRAEYPFVTNNQISSCSFFGQIEVTDCEATYELQGDATSNNLDHLNTQLFISKRNSLDKGWVSTT